MSSNNELTINRKTFEVFYNACVDNNELELVGKGENLEEAVGIAIKYIEEELGGGLYLEFGIRFYD